MKKLLLLSLMFVGLFVSCQKEKTTLESQDLTVQKEADAASFVTFSPIETVEDRELPLPCCWITFDHIQYQDGFVSAVFNVRRPKYSRYILKLTHVPSGQIYQAVGDYSGTPTCSTFQLIVSMNDLACQQMGELSGNFTVTLTNQVPDPYLFNGWVNCATATSTPVYFDSCL